LDRVEDRVVTIFDDFGRPQTEWLKAKAVKSAKVKAPDGYVVNWDSSHQVTIPDLADIDNIIEDGSLGGSDN